MNFPVSFIVKEMGDNQRECITAIDAWWYRMVRFMIRLIYRRRKEGEIIPPFWFKMTHRLYTSRRDVWFAMPICWFVEAGLFLQWRWAQWRSKPSAIMKIAEEIANQYRASEMRDQLNNSEMRRQLNVILMELREIRKMESGVE